MASTGHSFVGNSVGGSARVQFGDQYITNVGAETEEQKILHWLSPIRPWARHEDARNKRQQGTLEWFFKERLFQKWLAGDIAKLWCHGHMGAGKTVLMSAIVEHIQQTADSDTRYAVLYCNYQDREEQTLLNVLGCILRQLYEQEPNGRRIPDVVHSEYNPDRPAMISPRTEDIQSWLSAAIAERRTFLLLDGLDEMPEDIREDLIATLQLGSRAPQTLITSRELPDIFNTFEPSAWIRLRSTHGDVARVIAQRFSEGSGQSFLRRFKSDPDLQERITACVIGKAQGMFLLASLHIDTVMRAKSLQRVEDALASLPLTLDQAYHVVCARVLEQGDENSEDAKAILTWVHHSFRPLTTVELQHALATSSSISALNRRAMLDADYILSVCAGLLTDNDQGQSESIAFSHYSVKEFFTRHSQRYFPGAHSQILTACLRYLQLDDFKPYYGWGGKALNLKVHEDDFSFCGYCAVYWAEHAKESLSPAQSKVLDFVSKSDALQFAMQVCRSCIGNRNHDHWWHVAKFPALWVAVETGLLELTRELLTLGHNPNVGITATDVGVPSLQPDEAWRLVPWPVRGQTPMHKAAAADDVAALKLLLEYRGDPNAVDALGEQPLHFAARNGDTDCLRLLIEFESSADSQRTKDRNTALHVAASSEYTNGIRPLTSVIPVDAKNSFGETPLFSAVSKDHMEASRLLIELGADVNAADYTGRTSLMLAARRGLLDHVQWLIEQGAQPYDKDVRGDNAMDHVAMIMSKEPYTGTVYRRQQVLGHLEKLYLRDHKKVSNAGFTLLHCAALRGDLKCMSHLIEAGAELNAVTRQGETPLILAARRGYVDCVRCLVSDGAALGIEDGDANDALACARAGCHISIASFLSELSHESPQADENGYTDLHHRAKLGNVSRLRHLIDRGANVNAATNAGSTPLTLAAEYGHLDCVRFLVEKGSHIEVQDQYGNDPVACALSGLFCRREDCAKIIKYIESVNRERGYGQLMSEGPKL